MPPYPLGGLRVSALLLTLPVLEPPLSLPQQAPCACQTVDDPTHLPLSHPFCYAEPACKHKIFFCTLCSMMSTKVDIRVSHLSSS